MKKRKEAPPTPEPFFDEMGFFRFRPVSSDARKAVSLSPLPPRLMEFFGRFESSCAMDCCGIAALVFEPPTKWDNDRRWNFDYEVVKVLQSEIKRAEAMEAEVVQVRELQQFFYTDDWLFFLRSLMKNMEKSKGWNQVVSEAPFS